ncbi:hypothetical protein [uncultured Sulfitobacter sp.]|uniref:hypothetical protein n=1 Tax=uncultured Sulfitobacter sp. TaxID=191468 RepID=UPI002624D988|nr:hypothetical protein [uncultured Sulfitobacter sp.]
MKVVAGITLCLCMAAPLFAQVVTRPQARPATPAVLVPQMQGPDRPIMASSRDGLTAAEAAEFRREVRACWLADANAPAVTLGFSLDRSGRPGAGSVREVRHGAGGNQAVSQAFAAAKRAVLRCGRDGYTLPVEKYDQWRDIELTFSPERMN